MSVNKSDPNSLRLSILRIGLSAVIALVALDLILVPIIRPLFRAAPKITKENVLKVPIFEAKPGDLIQSTIEAVGIVRGPRSVKVKFPERGRLIWAKEGQAKKGEVVVRMDTGELDGMVQSTTASFEKAFRQAVSARIRQQTLGRGVDDVQMHNAQSDAKKAAGELERAIGARSKFIFRAPFTGQIGALRFRPGDIVSGETITVFSENVRPGQHKMNILVQFDQSEIGHVMVGKSALAYMPDGSVCTGVITKVDRGVNEFGFFCAEVEVEGHEHAIPLPGDTVVKVRFRRNPTKESNTYVILKSAIALPNDYDRQRGIKKPVYIFMVTAEGRARQIKVEVLASSKGKYCKVFSSEEFTRYVADASIAADGAIVERDPNPVYTDDFEPTDHPELLQAGEPTEAELMQRMLDAKKRKSDAEKEIIQTAKRIKEIQEKRKIEHEVDELFEEPLKEAMPQEDRLIARIANKRARLV